MDMLIPEEIVQRRKRKRGIWIALAFAGLIALIFSFRILVKPSVSKSSITTFLAEEGPVENTISATGEVLPEFEQVITSPIQSSIQDVLVETGATLHPGQAILTLDKSGTVSEFDKQKFQLESKRNMIDKLSTELNKSFFDLKSNNEIKRLKIASLKASLEDYRRLFKAGGATREDVAKAELDLKVAELEKKQLENEIRSKQATMKAEMRESKIAFAIQQNELSELERKLKQASIQAGRRGVVTWVNRNIGAGVREGDVLARIADLKTFKVSGSVSDNYLSEISKNMAVLVRVNDSLLTGQVSNVSPSVQNGLISFDVQLQDKRSRLLRPNLKVDVYLVTESRARTIRVANGPAFKGKGAQDVFVVKGNKAERRAVHTGLSNFDYIEVLDGLRKGERVITSDMSEFKNAEEITIKE
ncbi:efflux RND transporter periplasmic adaptor subunit [Arcticibacter sp. MXS-1]|uniref:efflux RND transporter periplasmic adaptor subunit n=1 Tax=Arcticibacter sp. MXS-1 TaxID=3341726 RepID=UPI0035A916B2